MMNFRIEYAENVVRALSNHVKIEKNGSLFWDVNIHVSNFWHFNIQYQFFPGGEKITITHKRRNLQVILKNGVFIKSEGIRRFDMLFAALNSELISMLKNHKTFKITRTKLNERYLTKTLYFWMKIDYYLHKKEAQEVLYELFGDEKYRQRAKRIERGIQRYIENKRNFIQKSKKETVR